MTELRVEACGPADREEQARLFNACFKKPVDAEGLAWRYDRNPHGGSISLLVREPGGRGVSGYACSPRRALAWGAEASAAPIGETGDVMTHPEWRKRGLFSDLDRAAMRAAAERGWPVCFGLPNRRSAHIFLELGWERVGTVRPWTQVIADGPAAREERGKEGRLRRWLTPLGARHGARARRRLEREGAGFDLRDLERFPREVEALSREVEPHFALMVRRDADYLDWRFLASPSRRFRVLGAFARDGAFAGYAVVQLPRDGEPLGWLVDALAPDRRALAALLAGALGRIEAAGASLARATAIDGSWWAARLGEAGFLAPRRENHLIVILHVHDPAHPLARAARDARSWYLTDGDRDDETMG